MSPCFWFSFWFVIHLYNLIRGTFTVLARQLNTSFLFTIPCRIVIPARRHIRQKASLFLEPKYLMPSSTVHHVLFSSDSMGEGCSYLYVIWQEIFLLNHKMRRSRVHNL